MSTTKPRKPPTRKTSAKVLAAARDEIRRVFERAEYNVEDLADSRPGVKVGLARSSKGLVRTATYFEIWLGCPKQLKPALVRLDGQRKRHDAVRALGIVLSGNLPSNYATDLDARPVNAITRRRLYFELSGLADELRSLAKSDENSPGHPTNFMQRKLLTADGRPVDATARIDSWLADTKPSWLVIDGPASSGKNTLLAHLYKRAARSWVAHPERVRPFVDAAAYEEWLFRSPAFDPDWVVCTSRISGPAFVANEEGARHRWLYTMLDGADSRKETREVVGTLAKLEFLTLKPLDPDQVLEWYGKRIPAPVYRRLTQVWELSPEFAMVASQLAHLAGIVQAALSSAKHAASKPTGKARGKPPEPLPWLADLMVRFLSSLKDELEEELDALDTGALEEFEHGHSRTLTALYEDLHSERVEDFLAERDDGVVAFVTPLIRDYFVARKLCAEVQAGRADALTRLPFPRKFVPLYLTVMAPEIAAQVQIDESADVKEDTATVEIELDEESTGASEEKTDVELEHASGFAGRLSRTASGLRSSLQRVLRDPQIGKRYQREIERARKELARLDALARRAHAWYLMPEPIEQSFPLRALVAKTVAEQRKRFPGIPVTLHVGTDVVVSASREHLQQALVCLLENAMQAVAEVKPPMVTVSARYLGTDRDTVRIDVTDNGPGIPDGERERIFEAPSGDSQQPGSGLQIARRYAAAMGAYVSLDEHAEKTSFSIELAAGRIAP